MYMIMGMYVVWNVRWIFKIYTVMYAVQREWNFLIEANYVGFSGKIAGTDRIDDLIHASGYANVGGVVNLQPCMAIEPLHGRLYGQSFVVMLVYYVLV